MSELSVTLVVRVTPRASRNGVAGVREDGVLLVRTSAAPVDGAANAAVIQLVADLFGLRRSQVAVKSGLTSRDKILTLSGISAEERDEKLRQL